MNKRYRPMAIDKNRINMIASTDPHDWVNGKDVEKLEAEIEQLKSELDVLKERNIKLEDWARHTTGIKNPLWEEQGE